MAKEYYEYDTDTNSIKPVVKDGKPKKESKVKGAFAKVDKWKLFKQVVGAVASGCASVVMSKYLRANMPGSDSAFEKAVMGVGVYFITGVVGSKVAKYTEEELDEWRDSVLEAKEED